MGTNLNGIFYNSSPQRSIIRRVSPLPKHINLRRNILDGSRIRRHENINNAGVNRFASELAPDTNWILAQGPDYNFELSILMTQNGDLLVWR